VIEIVGRVEIRLTEESKGGDRVSLGEGREKHDFTIVAASIRHLLKI